VNVGVEALGFALAVLWRGGSGQATLTFLF
jgi:hypothetical protein